MKKKTTTTTTRVILIIAQVYSFFFLLIFCGSDKNRALFKRKILYIAALLHNNLLLIFFFFLPKKTINYIIIFYGLIYDGGTSESNLLKIYILSFIEIDSRWAIILTRLIWQNFTTRQFILNIVFIFLAINHLFYIIFFYKD